MLKLKGRSKRHAPSVFLQNHPTARTHAAHVQQAQTSGKRQLQDLALDGRTVVQDLHCARRQAALSLHQPAERGRAAAHAEVVALGRHVRHAAARPEALCACDIIRAIHLAAITCLKLHHCPVIDNRRFHIHQGPGQPAGRRRLCRGPCQKRSSWPPRTPCRCRAAESEPSHIPQPFL